MSPSEEGMVVCSLGSILTKELCRHSKNVHYIHRHTFHTFHYPKGVIGQVLEEEAYLLLDLHHTTWAFLLVHNFDTQGDNNPSENSWSRKMHTV